MLPEKINLPQNSVIPTSKEEFITTFCDLVDQGKIPEAIAMIDLKDDNQREAWKVTLDSFSSFKLKNIKSLNSEPSQNSFEADIDIILKENQNPTGWVNGINKKRINLTETEPQIFKIKEIITEQ